jgi:hypothetical protein
MSTMMTHTLPTLVGMGVVARVAEKTLGGRSSRGKSKPKRKPKIHKGPRGGKYIIRKGRKVYV